jgi:hypothetical protein
MVVKAGSGIVRPSHVFTLTDGKKTIGIITCDQRGKKDPAQGFSQSPMPRTPLKISQGNQGYEDFELPFTSIEMKDWVGGMLAENFEDDRTKYRDARHADTTRGDIICGPKETLSKTLTIKNIVGNISYNHIIEKENPGGRSYLSKYTPNADLDVYGIRLFVKEGARAVAEIWSDNAGVPDALLASGSITLIPNSIMAIPLSSNITLTSGTDYWIGAFAEPKELADNADLYVRYTGRGFGGICGYSRAGQSTTRQYGFRTYLDNPDNVYMLEDGIIKKIWNKYNMDFQLYIGSMINQPEIKFYQFKRSLYAVVNPQDGSAPSIYRNGYRGAAISNSGNLFELKTNLNLAGVDLSGAIAIAIEGPGANEERPWRKIRSNTTTGANDIITVEQPWLVTHTTATSFVIVGTDYWNEITGHGLTGRIQSISVTKNYVTFAMGASINMRRMREYNNSGTWTVQYEDDGTAKADVILTMANSEGENKIWRAIADSNEVYNGNVAAWGTPTTWGTAIPIGTRDSRIKNMIDYGDPQRPVILKEDSFGTIHEDIYAEFPLGEMAALRSEYNGIAAVSHGVYLYFNLKQKIQRFYDGQLGDVGPDREEGLPSERQGIVRSLLAYPGKYYALLYSDNNVPSILCQNGMGWHEIWRPTHISSTGITSVGAGSVFDVNLSNVAGFKASNMIVQVIPGDTSDRLWFDYGGDINRIPIALVPQKDPDYTYASMSQVETAWIYGNLKDIDKYWHSIKLHTERLSGDKNYNQVIRIEYQVDEDEKWTLAGYITKSPIQELPLSSNYNVTGFRIRFRFTLYTANETITPRIIAAVVKGVVRVETKKGWAVTYLAVPNSDLNDQPDTQGDINTQLDIWANSDNTPAPLMMRHNIAYYDNKRVFIDPASLKFTLVELEPTKGDSKRHYQEIGHFTMYEV